MKRSRKSNTVSWAPGVNLCQVKLFLTDDCPSKVGGECRDTLQGKTSWSLHPNKLPPGFEGVHYVNGLKYALAEMPRIPWTCPPKFVFNFNWRVAAAEESMEVEAQKLREMRVLEAVYPRLSAIPPNPSVSMFEPYDDSRTPVVPLTPIEDDEGADISSDFAAQEKTPSNPQRAALTMPQGLSGSGTCNMPHCPSSATKPFGIDILPGVNSDVIVAASAALTAVTKGKEQGSLIDTDLLVKILSDPKMVEKLINDHGYLNGAANEGSTPVHASEPKTGIRSLPCTKSASVSSPKQAVTKSNNFLKEFRPMSTAPASKEDIVSVSMSKRVESSVPLPGTDINMTPGYRAANGNAFFTLNQLQPAHSMMPIQRNFVQEVQPAISSTPMQVNTGLAIPAMKTNPSKHINYLKNLIREHGRDKQEIEGHNISQTVAHSNQTENPKLVQNLKPMALNAKYRKPCMYFNSSRGCRNGSNCTFMHDKSFQWQTGTTLEATSAKRMKLNCEITGRI